jgi:hypothetical protein
MQNYQSCFSTSPGTPNLSQKYQIFNSTNYLALYWSGGRDGVYLFSAIVLDPEYRYGRICNIESSRFQIDLANNCPPLSDNSFCTLRTHFAISVYGAPLDSGVQVGIVVALVFGVMIVLVGSYFWYRRNRTKKDSSKEKLT